MKLFFVYFLVKQFRNCVNGVWQGIQKPAWLDALYAEKFFVGCPYHETAKKNEKNVCCLDCCISLCPHCVPSHRFHRLLQVRRYVYHDVVRLEDLQKLIDCSNVQVSDVFLILIILYVYIYVPLIININSIGGELWTGLYNKQCKSGVHQEETTEQTIQRSWQLLHFM